jgi:hypothetical protein
VSGGAPQPRQRFTGAERSSRSRVTHLGGHRTAGATGVGRAPLVGLLQPLVTSRTSSNGRPTMRLGYAGQHDT